MGLLTEDRRLMGTRRQKNQMELAFMAESRGEAPMAANKGTEAPMAKRDSEQLNQPNRRGTDPYARWCDRESP